jgi:hypothetical protein
MDETHGCSKQQQNNIFLFFYKDLPTGSTKKLTIESLEMA